MKILFMSFLIVLYTVLALGANSALADHKNIENMQMGEIKNFIFHDTPLSISKHKFQKSDGQLETLEKYRGKFVLLNFWATWCPPCRYEMPMLSNLQETLGSDDFEVVTLATGFNKRQKIEQFFDEIEAYNLPQFMDIKNKIAADMGVNVLPVSVLINPEGKEIGRVLGEVQWDSADAKAFILAVIAH